MITAQTTPPNEHAACDAEQAGTPGIWHDLIVERLRMAEAASRGADGELIPEWVAMHIWLAQCELICSATIAMRDADAPKDAIWKRFEEMTDAFALALAEVMPLWDDFIDAETIKTWRASEAAAGVASDGEFIERAQAAGLPVAKEDIAYAMGGFMRERGVCRYTTRPPYAGARLQ